MLFDQKIILNSFRSTIKSKFTLIWFGIMTPIIIAIFLTFAFLSQQKRIDYLGYQIIAISLSVLVTILIWEIVNLNFVFSSSRELGIVNLEIRKGRTAKEIFFSRLLVNKIFSIGYLLLMMGIFLIVAASLNSRDLTLFWLFLTFIPTDLFLTAVFLFFMSMGHYKLTIALTSILLTLIALTPFLQMVVTTILTGSSFIGPNDSAKFYSASRVLTLATNQEQKEKNGGLQDSFTYELLKEGSLLNEVIDLDQFNEDEENQSFAYPKANKELVKNVVEKIVFDGLILDSAMILNNMWTQLPELQGIEKKEPLKMSEKMTKESSLLYEINDTFKNSQQCFFAQEYQNSLYANHQVTNARYQSIIQKLKKLIEKINLEFGDKYYQVKEFNQIVLDYAQGMLFNHRFQDDAWIEVPPQKDDNWNPAPVRFPYQEYLQRISNSRDSHLYGLEYQAVNNNQKTLFSLLTIAPELRLWNEIVVQLIQNALDIKLVDMEARFEGQKKAQWAAFIPWAAQYETWFFANPNLNFYDYYRLQSGQYMEFFAWYWNWNDPYYYNAGESSSNEIFKPLTIIKKTQFSDETKNLNLKSFSVLGYELAIIGLSFGFTGFAFLIFLKKIKK